MKDLTNFANILNAELFIANNNEITSSKESTPASNSNLKEIKKAIPIFSNYPQHLYQALNFSSGYILNVTVSTDTNVYFLFDFTRSTFSESQFRLVSILTKLNPISQTIYRLYTAQVAPTENIYIHNRHDLTSIQRVSPNNPDCASYYELESEILNAVIYSNQDNLISALDKLPLIHFFDVLDLEHATLRQKKDFIVSYIAILTHAIDQWGYPIEKAFKIQADLVQEIEHSTQLPDLINTLKGITWFYFKTIQNYRTHNFLPLPDRIMSYINEHVCDNINLDDIAKAVHASKKNLNPAFKEKFGITITQFIRKNKIDRAKEILIVSDAPIPDIAKQLAFSTPSYFIKTFKKVTGLTPKYFRNHFLEDELNQ